MTETVEGIVRLDCVLSIDMSTLTLSNVLIIFNTNMSSSKSLVNFSYLHHRDIVSINFECYTIIEKLLFPSFADENKTWEFVCMNENVICLFEMDLRIQWKHPPTKWIEFADRNRSKVEPHICLVCIGSESRSVHFTERSSLSPNSMGSSKIMQFSAFDSR